MKESRNRRRNNPFGQVPSSSRTVSLRWMSLGCIGLTAIGYMMVVYLFMAKNNHDPAPQTKADSTITTTLVKRDNALPVPNQSSSNNILPAAGVTIGFAITVTGCGAESLTEAAAVLKHSIHLASVHGNQGGRYDYVMYALYHPDGETCAMPLKDLGYELVRRETPVQVEDIEGEYLRTSIRKNGCCGEKELVKLEAYTFVQHPIVVHLDLDVLVLKPLDPLFDWMLHDPNNIQPDYDVSNMHIMWPERELPRRVNAFFTRDCKWNSIFRHCWTHGHTSF